MILNAYAVLDGFVGLLRLILGIVVVVLAVSAWRHWGPLASAERRDRLEDRYYLLFVQALLLLGLNFASWPLLYLLLQSYVPEWPEVMCIYGVTRIGTGSLGPSRFLPALLTILQIAKPVLVFVSGAWFVLYLLNRRTRTAPITSRVLAVMAIMGVLAVADALAETTYLAIPKKEEFYSGGCCAEAFDSTARSSRFLPEALLEADYDRWLSVAYFGINGLMVLGTAGYGFRPRPAKAALLPLLLASLIAIPVSGVFLIEIGAPAILRRPFHHCPYDLVSVAPWALLGIAWFAWASFSVGWACVAACFADVPETSGHLQQTSRALMLSGAACYLLSLVMMSVELLSARP
jgi:hypothetical protein